MHRRHLLLAGGSLIALSPLPVLARNRTERASTSLLEADAAIARAILPVQDPVADLLKTWTGPHGGVPPWDRVNAEALRAALVEGIDLRRAEYAAIAANPQPAIFANTCVAMQMAGEPLNRAASMFYVMTANVGSADYQALEREVAPLISAADDEVIFNAALFARVKAVADTAGAAGLSSEQTRVATRSRDSLARRGAGLNSESKAELGRINTALANAFTTFSQKLLVDSDTFTHITDETGLAGLPASDKAAAAAAARRLNLDGWAIINNNSSVGPFLTFADDRAQRERVFTRFVQRGDNRDANDTHAVASEILALRHRRARLLGFAHHAEYRLQDTMAKTPQAVMDLVLKVWEPAKAKVVQQVAELRALAGHDIARWDFRYYAEKLRRANYDLDQSALKPYFELNAVKRGAFYMAERLYGFRFARLPTGTVPVFHPDVEVFEVQDSAGRSVGLFYSDDFARVGKRSGAWATTYRSFSSFDGPRQVLASNNNNFTKAEAGAPLLISLNEARTLFHEFGHALQYLSSTTTYPDLSRLPQDYVEYPSQVHENWVLSRPILDGFMRHYQTGEPMPEAMVAKIEAATMFDQAFRTVALLSSTLVDMDIHTQATPPTDLRAFEHDSLARIGMPAEVQMAHRLPHFQHIFGSDAYSAGFYSYLWSDVMAADTWAAFKAKADVFDPDLARRYQSIILAEGNSTDRAEAYRRFLGRDPDVTALLNVRGLPSGVTPSPI